MHKIIKHERNRDDFDIDHSGEKAEQQQFLYRYRNDETRRLQSS